MNSWRDPFDDEKERSALAIVRQVNSMLAPMLVELYGEGVQLVEAADPTTVCKSYLIEDFGFHLRTGLALHNETAAVLTAVICVGRFYRGFRKAMRWLANNRASNTVAFVFDEQRARESELWLCCTRITTPEDSVGLLATLKDIHEELGMVDAGLRMWFPQVLRGQMLVELEELAQNDEDLRALLASPKDFLAQPVSNPGIDFVSDLIRAAHGWLGQWSEQLCLIDQELSEPELNREDYLWCRARPLLELRRYDELINVCDELDLLSDESEVPMIAGVRGHALYEQGQFEEVLDSLRSATLDDAPRVCLFRSLAHARLGNHDAAIEAYMDYGNLVGNDIIATRMLREVLPDEDSELELT